MTTLQFTKFTSVTPEQFRAALTDFGPGRSEVFPNSSDAQLVVHDTGPDFADVTEGGGGTWERLRYDWSDPTRIVMTTTDSNVWGGASGHTYTLTSLPDGRTRLDVVVVRDGKNLKGRVIALGLRTGGKRFLEKALDHTIAAIEAKNGVPAPEVR
jgi:hypothetical protein